MLGEVTGGGCGGGGEDEAVLMLAAATRPVVGRTHVNVVW